MLIKNMIKTFNSTTFSYLIHEIISSFLSHTCVHRVQKTIIVAFARLIGRHKFPSPQETCEKKVKRETNGEGKRGRENA